MSRKRKQKGKPFFPRKKRSVFRRPHPLKRKMVLRQKKMKAFFVKHNPRAYFEKSIRKLVGQVYTMSDKFRDKIAESPIVLDHPFNVQFYQDRCSIQ